MDKNEAIRIASKYLKYIWTFYNVKSAILFGSYARETSHEDGRS